MSFSKGISEKDLKEEKFAVVETVPSRARLNLNLCVEAPNDHSVPQKCKHICS